MKKMSIRTLLLLTLGAGILLSIFTYGSTSANMFHSLLVLAFAIPGASWGYDITRTSRGLVVGCCASAVIGTVVLSTFFLLGGFE